MEDKNKGSPTGQHSRQPMPPLAAQAGKTVNQVAPGKTRKGRGPRAVRPV